MHKDFETYFLKRTGASGYSEKELIQKLWSDYGDISRYKLTNNEGFQSVVIKSIDLSKVKNHPRGWNTNFSHQRKVESYRVESHWYEHWSTRCGNLCKVPEFLGSYAADDQQWIIMEDLQSNFPVQKESVDFSSIELCLKWLANFHSTFLHQEAKGLWEVGTYWNLATRPDEFEQLEHPELRSKAQIIDNLLNDSKYKTIVHGDAKLANFCFSEQSRKVAAVDFQYVGGGCGIKDVAYFLSSCLSGDELQNFVPHFLDVYFLELRKRLLETEQHALYEIDALEEEWRSLYAVAYADFVRFLLGWMPKHSKINAYSLSLLNNVLAQL